MPGPLDLRGLHAIADLPREDLKYPAFVPITHRQLAEVESASPVDVFKAARRHDVLLHHPYDSFATSVQRFLEQAAADPHVLAIKQTLYRTSGDSPIIDALIDAAEAGKQVLVIVEIKARFDEEANIRWARKLEQAGCHVVYGLVGLKTHCKLAMVVRDEPDGHPPLHPHRHRQLQPQDRAALRGPRAAHHRRGDRRGRRPPVQQPQRLLPQRRRTTRLLVAPDSVRTGWSSAIHREIDHHRNGRPARIRLKANSIVDEATIDALYLASQAGVPVEMLVRGICALRPGVPGLSENIRVRSILGRFLEHSRIFWFENGGEPERVDRLRRPDAPQPRPSRRGAGAAAERGQRRPGRPSCSTWRSTPDTYAWELGPDGEWAPNGGTDHLQESLIERQRRRSCAAGPVRGQPADLRRAEARWSRRPKVPPVARRHPT